MIQDFFRSIVPQNTNIVSTYYVSNAGTGDGSSINNPIHPDDIVYQSGRNYQFKSGERFKPQLVNAPNVTIGSYGVGLLPEINASEDISTLPWTDNAGIWSTPMAQDPKWIFINDVVAKMSETSWIQITGRPSTSQVSANQTTLDAFLNIVGSKLVAKDNPWRMSIECTVTGYNAGTISITPELTLSANTSLAFKLYNKAEYIADNNDWAWEDGILYVKSTVSPALLDIRKATADYIIKATAPGLTVETVRLNQAYGNSVKNEADNTSILNCEISNCRGDGVKAEEQYSSLKVEYCLIEKCSTNGISIGPSLGTIVRKNTIRDIGMGLNYGWAADGRSVGFGFVQMIDLNLTTDKSSNVLIEYNDIYNLAYCGIGITNADDSIVRKNVVTNFLNRFTDGSGIYLVKTRLHNLLATNNTIESNFVSGGNNITEGYSGIGFCSGIYVDNRVENTIVANNTIYDVVDAALNLNWDTKASTVTGNIAYDCASLMRFRRGGQLTLASPDNQENILSGNIFVAKTAAQLLHECLVFDGSVNYNPFAGGSSNNNYYIQPYTTKIGEHPQDGTLTFADLQTRYGSDGNSKTKINYKVSPEVDDIILYTNETDISVNQLIPAGYEDVDGVNVGGQTLSIQAYSGLVVLKSNAVALSPENKELVTFASSIFPTETTKYYLYEPEGTEQAADDSLPCIIHLHGAGEFRDHPSATTEAERDALIWKHGPPKHIQNGDNLVTIGLSNAIVYSPQQPYGTYANNTNPYDGWNDDYMLEIYGIALLNPKVDPNKIIITGLSMGAKGALRSVSENPSKYYKCLVTCPNVGDAIASVFANDVPLWIVHGNNDSTVGFGVGTSKTFIDTIKDLNPTHVPKSTWVTGLGHDSWSGTFNAVGWPLAELTADVNGNGVDEIGNATGNNPYAWAIS